MSALPLFHSFGLTVGPVYATAHRCRSVSLSNPLHYRIVPGWCMTAVAPCCSALRLSSVTTRVSLTRMSFYRHHAMWWQAQKSYKEITKQLWRDKFGLRIP